MLILYYFLMNGYIYILLTFLIVLWKNVYLILFFNCLINIEWMNINIGLLNEWMNEYFGDIFDCYMINIQYYDLWMNAYLKLFFNCYMINIMNIMNEWVNEYYRIY